jgi:hypothetical protein
LKPLLENQAALNQQFQQELKVKDQKLQMAQNQLQDADKKLQGSEKDKLLLQDKIEELLKV